MNMILAAASATALATFLVHWQIGGIYAAKPLLAATDITEASRWLNYFCWHIVTILLLIMTVSIGLGATGRVSDDTLRLIVVIAASISVLSVGVTTRAGINPLRFPATYLLAAVAGLTWAGL